MLALCSGASPALSEPAASLSASSCLVSLRSPTGRRPDRVGCDEIKFDGYRVIARKDGDQVRVWARTTPDYSKAFTRIRDAVAALPVESAVIDGEAVLMRSDNTFDFEGLRFAGGASRRDPGRL